MSGVRYSAERGRLYADVNTSGSVTLMDEARKHEVSVFVYASTSNVYGDTARVPFVEDDAAALPLSPYPASKRAAEIFAHSYHQLFGLNVNILRFFNVYGPHGRPDMMPLRAIDAILHGKLIEMYDGGDLQRDWTYIDDMVDGIVAALERPLGYQIMNLGYGSPITFSEFIHIYEGLIGKAAITKAVDAPLTEPKITYCDNSRAANCSVSRRKSDIAEGLARTWDWYCQRYSIQQKMKYKTRRDRLWRVYAEIFTRRAFVRRRSVLVVRQIVDNAGIDGQYDFVLIFRFDPIGRDQLAIFEKYAL